MGAPFLQSGTCVHHSRSRLSCGVTRTVPDQHFADFTTSYSSRRKNLATVMTRYRNYAFPAKEARVFTLTQRLWSAARHNRVLASKAICFSLALGATDCPTFMSMSMPRCSPMKMGSKCPFLGWILRPNLVS